MKKSVPDSLRRYRYLLATASIVLLFTGGQAQAPKEVQRFLNILFPRFQVINNTFDHLNPDFSWSMAGQLQAEINAGITALDERELETALIHLNKANDLDSSNWVARYYRGVCFKKMQNLRSAINDLSKAAELNPKLAEAHIELGEIYLLVRDGERSDNEFEKAVRKNPSLPEGHYGLGHIALLDNNINKAKRLYEKSIVVDSTFAAGYAMLASIEMQTTLNDAEPLRLLNKSIHFDSTFTPGYFWRGQCHARQGRHEKALADFNKAVELNPMNPFLIRARGFTYMELDEYSKAFVDLKNAFKIQHQELDENKFSGYQTDLDKQLDIQGLLNYLIANGYGLQEESYLLLQKSFCMLATKRYTGALAAVNEAELIEPSASLYYLKALILENSNQHEAALAYYDKALTRDQDIFEAHRKKCVYHFEMKDYKSAYADINEMFRLQPNSPVGHRFRGLIRSAQGYLGPAIADLSAFIKTDTTDPVAIEARHMCYVILKKWDEAKPDVEWLLRQSKGSWKKYDEFASQYLEAGDSAYAVKICDLFSAGNPGFYFSELKALEIYGAQRNWAEADRRIATIMSMTTEQKAPTIYSRLYYWKGFISRYRDRNTNDALIWFSKAVQFNSTDTEALYALADVFTELGDRKKALKAYEILAKNGYKDAQSRYDSLRNQKK